MDNRQNYNGLDFFRLPAAFLIIAIHISPLTSVNAEANFFLTRVLARLAVPFFFMITGCFCLRNQDKFIRQLKKLGLLYGFSILLYLPFGIYAGHYKNLSLLLSLRMLIFDGTFYHLWYFPACILGLVITRLLLKFFSDKEAFWAAGILYIFGLLGDSYYGLLSRIPAVSAIYDVIFHLFSYTRNGLFFAPVFLLLGARIKKEKKAASVGCLRNCLWGFFLSLLLMTTEAFTLNHFKLQRHDSMYIFLVPSTFFLFKLLLLWKARPARQLRTVSTWIYILHPAMIISVRGLAKVTHMTKILVENSLIHYITVSIISLLISCCIAACSSVFSGKKRSLNKKGRAWIELNEKALKNNVEALLSLLPEDCSLMPAVKANAYGHGAALIAGKLNQFGIRSFCVASLSEGIDLRRSGIRGEILILGYTHPEEFPLLRKYHLTQTVVDYAYALKLNGFGKKLPVHVAIDTGMHRLGERCENLDSVLKIFQMKNLQIKGLFTHLCAADVMEKREQEYTRNQVDAFHHIVAALKDHGIACPKLHLQSSYGLLNYPELTEDYVRIGIALYGVLSTREDTENLPIPLEPVLSLKARVAVVKPLYEQEAAGYGPAFVSDCNKRIAVITIGYADGLPRSLSSQNGSVLINGYRAPVIGRICMDQTLVDVSHIPHVKSGDIAVVIGKSGQEEISVCDLAGQTGTITNEILSRLGSRLERVVI